MREIEFTIFCIGLFTLAVVFGSVSSALGCKFGSYVAERNKKI